MVQVWSQVAFAPHVKVWKCEKAKPKGQYDEEAFLGSNESNR
jgi:hypothetical protein